MKNLRSNLLLGLVCLVLGLMISLQLRITSAEKSSTNSVRTGDNAIEEIEELTKQKKDLANKVQEYQKKVDEYEKSAASVDDTTSKMKEELDNLRVLAGLTDVEGEGIIIKISPIVDVTTKELRSVDDGDILDTVNELLASGAEAISINDERYITTSTIREAGKMIRINNSKFNSSEPFIIKAIGNKNVLEGAFKMASSVADVIKANGREFSMEKKQKVKILKYNKNIEYKYIETGR